MKISCQRNLLAAAVQTVGGVVPSRTPKEILKNIKLHVADRQATLIATDQEVGMRYELQEVDTNSAGEVLLPLQKLSAILREAPDEVVSLEVTEEALWIRSGHSEFRLSAADPAEFPDVPGFKEEAYYVISSQALKQGIQRTLFAADVESARYALGGVLLDLTNNSLTLAATDSHRLAVVKASCALQGEVSEAGGQPVVPSKAMSMIERSLQADDVEVRIAVHANDVVVQCGPATIYSRLVQGRFPKYQSVIPADSSVQIELVTSPFYSAVRQAMIVTNEESRGVDFEFKDGTLTLNSQAADVGTSKIELPIAYDGEAITVTFDPRFVADFLKVLDGSAGVTLSLIDANSAAVFRTDNSYTYVVMPLAANR